MNQTVQQKEFGKVRSLLWPIYNFELKKILPMLLMFFCISFNYTILRDMKDSLVVTAGGSGAEVLPFLKLGVLVGAVIFMLIYAKLSNKLSKPALFYATLSPFLVFFALFALIFYPAKDLLHPHAMADKLQAILPTGFMGLIAVFRNWMFSIFYILSELWGSVVLSLLFWGFANDITRVKEAKRFYALFLTGANVALLISGPTIRYFANLPKRLALTQTNIDPWGVTINKLMLVVVALGLLIMACYWWVNAKVLTDARFFSQDEQKNSKKSKPKLSMKDSFKFLLSSKYLGLLAVLVISYGIAINLIEVTWKSQLKIQYPHSNDYLAFMGGFSMVTGLVTIFTTMFLGGNIMRKFGWRISALLTPILLILTGISFLGFVTFKGYMPSYIAGGITLQMFIVLLGAAQNILTKSCKYTFFDPTKEMAYIPLDQESKVKGKAAIDVVGARLGKSGGSFLQAGLIVACGGIAGIAPYVMGVVVMIVTLWMLSANSLSKLFEEKSQETDKKKISEKDLKVVEGSKTEKVVS